MDSAVFTFFQALVRHDNIRVSTLGRNSDDVINKLIEEYMEKEKDHFIKAYEEGYDACFHHEQGKPLDFYTRKVIMGLPD